MSSFRMHLHHADGRLKGSYVYMLMCWRDRTIYIKVGMSDSPTRRLRELKTNCAVPPKVFAIVEAFSRREALRLEGELHSALQRWRGEGEWFLFREEDKGEFNSAWQEVFEKCASPGWPLYWIKIPVQPFARLCEQKRQYHRYRWRVRARAYQDFERHERELGSGSI